MEKSRLEIKVGLFVMVGLVLLAVLLIQFSKGTSIFRGTYELRLHASNVGGLKQRASVLLAGVQVGNVSGIQLAPDGKSVTIFLRIYKDYKIYHDARFVIEQSGFLGDQYVAVIPTANQPPVFQDGANVECEAPFNLQEVARSASGFIQRIDETAKKLDAAVSDVRRLVLNEETLTNFADAVGNLRAVTEQATNTVASINALVATNGAQIDLAVSNVVFFSRDLISLSSQTHDLISTNGPEIAAAISNVEASTEDLKRLMDDLRSGQGLAGAVLKNEQLSTNVQAIAANLAITTSNLNEFGLWHILWRHEAPPTRTTSPAVLTPHATGQQ
ncbi:MAG TPA: MlaD family protein [Candidatus Saccharimonadales bacterium]|nr:MlaD family protein [Candidatus Saccharimonadales bacterium]